MSADKKTVQVSIEFHVDAEQIVSLLVGAIEGGINYWAQSADYKGRKPIGDAASYDWYAEVDFLLSPGWKFKLSYDLEEGKEGDSKGRCLINLTKVRQGLRSMALNDPKHFADLISENADATTADVFMQHIVFGKVIYG